MCGDRNKCSSEFHFYGLKMQAGDTESANSDNNERRDSEVSAESEAALLQQHDLRIGEIFNSLEAFEERLHEFQDRSCTVFYKRDVVSIAQSRKKGIKRRISESLKYYSLYYRCIHGGKKFKSTATGQRSSSTFQQECDAMFRLTVSKDGNAFIVSDVNLNHNHQCSQNLYRHLPQSRRLKPAEQKQVANLLSLGANRKKVQQQIRDQTNKIILLKDLSNIASQGATTTKNDLSATVKLLEEKYEAKCDILAEDNVFKGLFFVTSDMKLAMESFPEFVGIDATYKLLDIRAPVYLTIVEDSEGCTEIVAVCILTTEDKPSMTWFFDCFKEAHPSWKNIKCFMADKDLLERDLIKISFPAATVLICIFHTFKTFNREITCDKLGITPGQRTAAKEILQKMVYAESEDQYMELYERLKELPRSIIDYFNNNWHTIRHEWTLCPNYMRDNFMNTTNNRIESLNAKIKSVVTRYSSLEVFVKDFFILAACLKTERDHKAAIAYQKTDVHLFKDNAPELFYSKLLTGYSFQFVQLELIKRSSVQIVGDPSAETYTLPTHRAPLAVTSSTCTCIPHISMKLPCRHIFAVRDHKRMSLEDESLFDKRWTREYYYSKQRVFQPNEISESVPYSVTSAVTTRRILSQHEKYKKAALVTKSIAELASEATGTSFVKRLKLLTDIKKAWEGNNEVSLTVHGAVSEVPETNVSSEVERDSPVHTSNYDLCQPSTSTNCQNVPCSSSQIAFAEPLPERVEDESDDSNNGEGNHGEVQDSSCTNIQLTTKAPTHTGSDLNKIVVPPAYKQKGRPKGAEKTVIGLPKRKALDAASSKRQPFVKKREEDKIKTMLQWFVDPEIAEAAVLKQTLIEESQIESRPERVTYAILDDDVNLPLIKRFFNKDAWQVVKGVLKSKNQNPQWECGLCTLDLDTTVIDENLCPNKSTSGDKVTIRCDFCLVWYHLPCVSLKKAPKTKYWMCHKCK